MVLVFINCLLNPLPLYMIYSSSSHKSPPALQFPTVAWKQVKTFSDFQPLCPQAGSPHTDSEVSAPIKSDKVLTFLKSPAMQMENVSSSGSPGECGRGECYSLWYWWRKAQLLAGGRMETCHRSTDTSLGLNKVVCRPRSWALLGALDRSSATNLPQSSSDILA